jgi:selenocysteine-specific elongation factor
MRVVGTAGHVDHGKSTLIEALTGIDPDRLAEEKARGMTIDLGFAWLKLPSGQEVSIVDVPGHERFIHNMLAGVGGIDIAMLVIAADEGVMPQTREHLDILDLLSIPSGIIVLTKSDLVDDEWLELVRAEVEEAVAAEAVRRLELEPKGRERRALERDFEEAAKRDGRRARTEVLDLALTLTGLAFRDLVCLAEEAPEAVLATDRAPALAERARSRDPRRLREAAERCEDVRQALELNVSEDLALSALGLRLAALAGAPE